MDLPAIINKINKDRKTIKITTMAKAKSMYIKRFPSGSLSVDAITGGGYAFRRMMMIYGQKSAGKNAHLYQTMAYNQRICRHCGGVLPELVKQETSSHIITGVDRWSNVLVNYMGFPVCGCANSQGRIFLFMDYEKSLSIEKPRNKFIKHIVDKKTSLEIDEVEYDMVMESINGLSVKENLTEEEKAYIKDKEKLIKGWTVTTQEVPMLDTADYLQKCGVDPTKLLVADPADAEEGINYLGEIIPTREVDVIIIDSLQSMLPQYVKGRDAEDATMGVEAKVNGLMSKKVCAAYAAENIEDEAEAYKPALFLISQVRSAIGGFSGGQPTFSGGHAIAHHISLALEFKREMFLKEDGTEASFKEPFYGLKTRVRAEKNKLSAPGDFALYDYYFRDGAKCSVGEIDHIEEITTMAIDKNVIERAGSYYRVNGEQFQGKNALVDYMRENPQFVGTIYSKLKG